MSGSSLTAASSIDDARTKAHLLLGQRLGALDLSRILVYMVNDVDASVLPALSWQFDMSSPLYELLGGSEQRSLIGNAIVLHARNGTPYAITTIMASLGFPNATIQEGQASWGGSTWPANEGWAVFRVSAPAAAPINAYVQQTAIAAINFFKPSRCWLDSLWFTAPPQSEAIPLADFYGVPGQEPPIALTDAFSVPLQGVSDSFAQSTYFNGLYYAAGGILANGTAAAIVDSGATVNGTPVT